MQFENQGNGIERGHGIVEHIWGARLISYYKRTERRYCKNIETWSIHEKGVKILLLGSYLLSNMNVQNTRYLSQCTVRGSNIITLME